MDDTTGPVPRPVVGISRSRASWWALAWAAGDISLEEAIVPGRAAVELAHIARGGDVLVLGSRHRGRLCRLAPGSVARACSRRAECPVVVVPEPSPRALAAALPADARSRWHWWPPHRETRMIP
ncbi:MAG TPA: universal stress protein [Trebonia sp.]